MDIRQMKWHPRTIDLIKAVDNDLSKYDFDELNFDSFCNYYLCAVAMGFKNVRRKMDKEFEIMGKERFIVPSELFTQLNPSMFSEKFAAKVWNTTPETVGNLVLDCYDYFPPSFGLMIAYIEALAFSKDVVAAQLKKGLQSITTINAMMPWWLELITNIPGVIDRLGELKMLCKNNQLKEEIAVEEDIEKHDELNPVLFDENGKLKAEIKEKALAISDELVKILNESDVKLVLKDLVITGSNASYNYTKDSDVDLHLVADTSAFEDPDGLYPIIYNAFKSAFNKKYDIYFYDVPVEVYIESNDTPLVSNGIYSVMYDKWVKEPTKDDIPEVDITEIDKEVAPWEERYKELVAKLENNPDADETEIDDFIDELYVLRGDSLKEGEYATGNLIFKEMRNRGYMDKLKELRDKIVTAKLSITDLQENLQNRELDFYRQEIQKLTHEQPIIQPNGIFELYNVREDDARFILNVLRRQDFIEYVQMSASKFDFQTMSRMGRPAQYYRIIGQLRV